MTRLTIVVPMAGRGSRFRDAGYTIPKPLIPVLGRPMIARVVDNVRPQRDARFVFLCQAEHIAEYALERTLGELAPGSAIVPVDGVTEGAACTVLLAEHEIPRDEPLMIVNSDQWVDTSIDRHLGVLDSDPAAAGLIMTMWADDPKWSFLRLDGNGGVTEVVEKQVVSNEATVGIYTFRRAGDFIDGAHRMITDNRRVNGEFYVAPVYNDLIARGERIAYDNIGRVGAGMHGLGTPADLEEFLTSPVSARLVEAAA